ncbi:MAG: hypothetical protein AAF701_08660 [Pseudomonadota bacterium]
MVIIIPARAGSKGIPGKNIRDFRGAPLVDWSFAAAQVLAPVLQADILCSTDDGAVADLARARGIAVRDRSADLASDHAGMDGVVIDACQGRADHYVLLQPTSPLRILSDLTVLSHATARHGTVVSCTRPQNAVEDLVDMTTGQPLMATPKTATRQTRKGQYRFVDGGYYAGRVEDLTNGAGFVPTHSHFVTLSNPAAVDIDTPYDFAMAEAQHDWLRSAGVDFATP